MWTHLIDNALARDGRRSARCGSRPDSTADAVVVEVADTGSGMSPETQKHAFDPFYTTKGVGEGTGLGLDISRRIVDRHRGDIGIEAGPGETVLRVRLPVDGVRTAPGRRPPYGADVRTGTTCRAAPAPPGEARGPAQDQ